MCCKYINVKPKPKILIIEVSTFLKILLVNRATNSVIECSCPTLRRLKTFLLASMSQERLNLMLLTTCNEWLDGLNLITIANELNDGSGESKLFFRTFQI